MPDEADRPERTAEQLTQLTSLALDLQQPQGVESMLQMIVDHAVRLLDAPYASVRLLDPTGSRLITAVRSGQSRHSDGEVDFVPGEGLIGWIVEHAESLCLGRAHADSRFVAKPGLTRKIGSFLGVPLVAGSRCMGVLSTIHPDEDQFSPHHEQVATLIAAICAPRVEAARLEQLSGIDPLTGVLNRRGFDRKLPEIEPLVRSRGRAMPLAVAMVDVDHFKRVNDEMGHAVGDEVLKAVGRILGEVVRQHDSVVRYGGEEFVLLLPQVEVDGARVVAERARTTIENSVLTPACEDLRVTISVGVAERKPGESRMSLVARADAAMYEAKQSGRNRVIMAE